MKILTLSLLLVPMMASALVRGNDGGGGNAIVCFNDPSIPLRIYDPQNPQQGVITDDMLSHITKIEAYDYAYAKLETLSSQPRVIAIEDNESFEEYVKRIAERGGAYHKGVPRIIEDGLKRLKLNQALFRENGVIPVYDINDVGLVDVNRCVVSTMAVQILASSNPLNIDKRLFLHPKHSRQSQAILILHEVLYAHLRTHFPNIKDSAKVRELVRIIATEGSGLNRANLAEAIWFSGYLNAPETIALDKTLHTLTNSIKEKMKSLAQEYRDVHSKLRMLTCTSELNNDVTVSMATLGIDGNIENSPSCEERRDLRQFASQKTRALTFQRKYTELLKQAGANLSLENVWTGVKGQLTDLGYSQNEQMMIKSILAQYQKYFIEMAEINGLSGFDYLVSFDGKSMALKIRPL